MCDVFVLSVRVRCYVLCVKVRLRSVCVLRVLCIMMLCLGPVYVFRVCNVVLGSRACSRDVFVWCSVVIGARC